MNYTLNQLSIFVKVTECQSITKAAEELYLTQPAVSIQLKKFQDQFDIPLTEVIGRQLFITDFGLEVAEAAKEVFKQIESINYKTQAFKGLLTGKLVIASVSTGKYVMPYFLTDFISMHQQIDLNMDVTNKSSVVDSLKLNAVDFALVSVLPEQLDIERIDLIKNKLYLVGSPKIIDQQKKYTYKVFEKTPLIFREDGSGTRRTIEEFLRKYNLTVKVKMELTSNEAVKQAVIAGLGFSIMPLIGIRNELVAGDLQIIPLRRFPIESTWSLIWLKGKKHSAVASAYLNYIDKEKEKIIDTWFAWYENHRL